MPSVKLYPNGLSGGSAGMNHGKAGIRGDVGGWSAASSRRNVEFLRSVRTDNLTGEGYSFTLTVRDCPATPKHWADWAKLYFKRLERAGALRIHWVIEWQRRGCPHLHGSVYFLAATPQRTVKNVIIDGWCYENPFDAGPQSQDMKPIYDAVGWAQYVAKHAARGVRHYQRSPENIPAGWRGRTGRMWGNRGVWPCDEPVKLTLGGREGDGGWFAFRRLVRSYAVSVTRRRSDWPGVAYSRTMLKASTRTLGEVRGLSSWVPRSVSEPMLMNLADRGYSVTSSSGEVTT